MNVIVGTIRDWYPLPKHENYRCLTPNKNNLKVVVSIEINDSSITYGRAIFRFTPSVPICKHPLPLIKGSLHIGSEGVLYLTLWTLSTSCLKSKSMMTWSRPEANKYIPFEQI